MPLYWETYKYHEFGSVKKTESFLFCTVNVQMYMYLYNVQCTNVMYLYINCRGRLQSLTTMSKWAIVHSMWHNKMPC